MHNTSTYFESNYKKLGLLILNDEVISEINAEQYKGYIKVLYANPGAIVTIDFKQYNPQAPSLFFINSNQYLYVNGVTNGYFTYYNRDFYCVQIHDAEVACDGLLFNNLGNMPMTILAGTTAGSVDIIFKAMLDELVQERSQQEEMLRIYLKQLIIIATRLWKEQQLSNVTGEENNDAEFYRQFSRLVEIHYKEKHTVADYADMLGMAPKTITHKLRKMHLAQPNEIIKERIILEAKRLLLYTAMSAKQVAYYLGYDDPAYFNRLFTAKVGGTTSDFRKKYNTGKNVQLT